MSAQQISAASGGPKLAGNTDTSLLKVIALVSMIIDHVGVAFLPDVRELRILGRIAMPLYAWCLVVGSEYTRNALKYALRLFVLGVISQPLYIMVLGNTWSRLNILFLFCLGVLAIAGIKEKWHYSQFWAPALCLVVVLLVDIDYGWKGFLFILFLYACRHSRSSLAAAFLASAVIWGVYSSSVTSFFGLQFAFLNNNLFSPILRLFFQLQSMMWLALPLILVKTRSKVRMPKRLGYGVYPLHLLALLIVGLLTGIPLYSFISRLAMF
jgi:hypothetical protein